MRIKLLLSLALLAAPLGHTITLTENFATDPALDGWQVFGNTNLLQWDPVNENIDVTWNSTNVNSYFYHPLGTTVTSASNFMFSVDFTLQDIAYGTTPNKPQNFQVAFGLLNFAEATDPGFYIGTSYNAPDVVELDYFPDDGYGASVTTPMISSENAFAFNYTVLALAPGALYHAVLTYTAANQTLHTVLSSNGVPVGPLNDNILPVGFDGFNVDTLSINCYTDEGQDTNVYAGVDYAGSIIAHGTVSGLFFATPLPVTQIITALPGSIQFNSTTNWNYVLERSPDLQSWSGASLVTPGIAGSMTLADTNAPASQAFYRIRADRP
jgi:hypothetical protein